MDLNNFISGDRYLPKCLRDFHDQKDFFKSLHDWISHIDQMTSDGKCVDGYKMPSWVEGQIYVIDYFLKFMALHGLTLQKSRLDCEFCDLDTTLKVLKDKEAEAFKSFLSGPFNKTLEAGG